MEAAIRRVEPLLTGRPLNVRLAPDLPALFIDGVQLQQVLVNLLDNAVKFSPADSAIWITAHLSDGTLEVAVTNQGPGVPAHELEKIFDRFYRVRSEHAPATPGTGLGLAICKGIIEAHGGTMTARSTPAADHDSLSYSDDHTARLWDDCRSLSHGERVMTQGARILVVDDEPQIRRSLQVNLERAGYAVDAVESGEHALESFRNRRPDVIILDLLMPGLGGAEVVHKIREVSPVPIIVLSAVGEESWKVKALELGADDYMTKPFGMDELSARIRSLLRRAAGAHGPEPVFVAGDLSVNFDRREVTLDRQPVKLTPTEYDLLKYMIEHAGKVLTHRMLLKEVWGQAYVDQAQYLRVFIGQLRKKLEREPTRPRFILTDPGVGYRFSADHKFPAS